MKKRSKGFTLVELVAVQVIICLLLIVTVPQAKLLLRKSRIQSLMKGRRASFCSPRTGSAT
jgi:prepilin-type N-terminal cleavage/methylation domain-containing protein